MIGDLGHTMRLYVLLFYLQLHLFDAEGIVVGIPQLKRFPRIIKYVAGDTLNFELSFKDFPQLPSDQYWTSAVYLVRDSKRTLGAPKKVTEVLTVIKHLLKSEKHIYMKVLDEDDDRTDFFVRVENEEAAYYYEEKIIMLQLQRNGTDEPIDACLVKSNKCRIDFLIWNPKKNPHTRLHPNGTLEVPAGEKVNVTCEAHNMPQNVRLVMYHNDKKVHTVTGDFVNRNIKIQKEKHLHSIYCVSHYISNDGSTTVNRRSNTLTIRMKDEPEQSNVTVVTKPTLSNVTFYQVGDRFSYNCTALKGQHRMTFSWTRKKDSHSYNTSSAFSVIDIVLDESYNNTEIRCNASFQSEPNHFDETFVATKLILYKYESLPWPVIAGALGGLGAAVLGVSALAAVLYCCRRRTTDHVVQVENELYADSGLQYAQLYEHRLQGAPPPRGQLPPYTNVIGYLRKSDH